MCHGFFCLLLHAADIPNANLWGTYYTGSVEVILKCQKFHELGQGEGGGCIIVLPKSYSTHTVLSKLESF